MRLVPMDLRLAYVTRSKYPNMSDAFHFTPSSRAPLFPKRSEYPDLATDRDGLDGPELAYDFELHA